MQRNKNPPCETSTQEEIESDPALSLLLHMALWEHNFENDQEGSPH